MLVFLFKKKKSRKNKQGNNEKKNWAKSGWTSLQAVKITIQKKT
jgi:hypothetical protein